MSLEAPVADLHGMDPSEQRAAEELELARAIILVGRRWRGRLDERLRAIGQTNARWATLYWVADSPEGLNQRDLAEKVGIETPTLVRLLDTLEAQGLVRRTVDPRDRRAKIVTATETAAAALADGDRIAAQMRGRLFAGSTPEQISGALAVLQMLSSRLERM